MILGETTALCGTCKRSVAAQTVAIDDAVYLRKTCNEHGVSQVLIASSLAWYQQTLGFAPTLSPPEGAKPVSQGCPFDCGPCTSHEQRSQLPIVPITSACNLDCPICYTHNRNEGAYHMSEAELRAVIAHIVANDPERRIINITGGEPTQHPQFERLIELCHEAGLHRITVSTHGLRFLKDEALVARLAALDARIVLSFDSFRAETNKTMLGGSFLDGKLRVLELLEKYNVNTTLLPVLARGVNSDEVGAFIKLALERPFIRSLELHTMTFTGQSGAQFDKVGRYTPYDVLVDIEQQTAGALRISDFVPSPAAHPLCYQVTYLLQTGQAGANRTSIDAWTPFARFMAPTDMRAMLAGQLYLEPTSQMEATLADVINRLWSGEIEFDRSDDVLRALRRVVDEAFDPQRDAVARMRAAEMSAKAIYVHSHMDEDTFDTDRIQQCCVGIREPDGRNIPSCAYNVLYRERDARFAGGTAAPPAPALITLGKGRSGSPGKQS
jgi:hypothetical protein